MKEEPKKFITISGHSNFNGKYELIEEKITEIEDEKREDKSDLLQIFKENFNLLKYIYCHVGYCEDPGNPKKKLKVKITIKELEIEKIKESIRVKAIFTIKDAHTEFVEEDRGVVWKHEYERKTYSPSNMWKLTEEFIDASVELVKNYFFHDVNRFIKYSLNEWDKSE